MKQLTFNFLRRQLLLIMAVIGFSTSMLANTTDVTYTEPTYICDKYDSGDKKGQDKAFEDFTDSYVETITLTNGSQEKTWNHPGTRTFWNVLSNMTMDAKAGETITANFVANSLGNYSESTVYQDLRFTAVVLAIDWNGDGTFEYAQKIVGNTPPTHHIGGNMDVLDFTYDIQVPEKAQTGTARVRFNYTNAWFGNSSANDFVNTCKEGIVYDFDINIVEPTEPGLEVTWEKPENGNITVKNGTEVLESPATVESGTKLTIVPTPESGRYELGTLTANDTPITLNGDNYEVTINESTVIAATFDIAKYQINWQDPTNGTIRVVYADNESQEVLNGSEVQLDTELKVIAEPSSSDYVLNRVYYVYGNGTEYDITKGENGYTFTVQETTNGIKTIYINAVFEKVVKYRITWAGEETMQRNSLKVVYADTDEEVLNSETLVTEGSVLKIIPTAVAGYHLSALSYTISGLQNVPFTIGNEPYTFTVEGGTEDPKMGYFVIISAGFTPDTYTLSTSVNPAEGGSVSVTTTDGATIEGSVTHGQTIVITASANDNYKLQSLDVTGATKVEEQENQYTVEDDVTVTATFVEDVPEETWSEVTFDSMSGLSAEVDLSKYTYTGNWTKEAYGASEAVQMDDNSKKYGPFISKPESGNYFATKYTVEKKATYRFSFLHKRADSKGAPASAMLYYATDLATMTESSEIIDIPEKAGNDTGDLFQSQSITLEPGDYYFIYYISSASMSGNNGAKIRIADFKLEMLDGSVVETTPEYTVTLNKPENGNISVTYNNGTNDVTVSTVEATDAQTFDVAENTKLTVTVTPDEGYQLETLSPEMTEVAGSENVYEYTVTKAVTIEATFTLIPDTDPIIGVGTDSATEPVASTADSPVWFVMKSSHLTVAERQNRFMYWNEEKSRLECTQHNEGIKLSEISDAYRWRFEDAEDGNIYIINKATGKALSVPDNASSKTGSATVNTPLTLEETGSKWAVALAKTVSDQALENQYCFDYVDYINGTEAAYLNAMDGGAAVPFGITVYEMGVQNASGWFIYKAPATVKMYNITVNKPVNGNISVTYNDGTDNVTVSTVEATDAQTFDVAENTKLTVTVTPDQGYMLESLSPEMTEVADSKNVYEYTVTEAVTIEAKFVEEVAFDYVPVTIKSGFNTDVIAEAKPSADFTSGTLDSQGWVLFTSDIQEEGALPLDLTTVDGIPYKMADVTSNNAAVLKGENTESTLVFQNPAKAEEVRLLSISAEGASTMEVTVNYEDGNSQTQSFTIADWWNSYGGQGEAYYGLDRIITEYESPYSKDQIDGRKQFRLFEQVVTTDPEKTIVSVKVVNRSTGTKTPSVLGVTVLGELLEVEPVMHSITVNKPVNGNLVISYMANDEMQSIETYSFENDSEVYSIEEGTVLSISVNPEFDYELDQILPAEMEEKTGLTGDTYYEYTVTGDATIEATFKPIQYGKVSAEASEEGNIEIQLNNPMTGKWVAADEFFLEQVEFGTELRAKVEANTGYELVSVMKNQDELSTEEEGYYYFTVDAEEITISAEFEAEEYTLTTEINPAEGGSVSVTVDGTTVEGTVKYGDVITVTVTENEGYLLESVVVEGAEEVDGQEGQYTVTGAVKITVTFTEDTSSINSIENGTVYYNAVEEVLYTGAAESVRVYDLSGRLVLNAENQDNVSLAELAEGIYTAVVDGKVIKLNK